jgi:hypothetical protein
LLFSRKLFGVPFGYEVVLFKCGRKRRIPTHSSKLTLDTPPKLFLYCFLFRAQLEKKLAAKDKEAKESKLRELAQKAREERAGNGADINLVKCK